MRVIVVHTHNPHRAPEVSLIVEGDVEEARSQGVDVRVFGQDNSARSGVSAARRFAKQTRPTCSLGYEPQLRHLIQQYRPQVLHLQAVSPLLAPRFVKVAKSKQIPVVLSVDSMFTSEMGERDTARFGQLAHGSWWQLVDRFLVYDHDVAERLAATGIPNGRISLRRYVPRDPGPASPNGSGVLYVGRLGQEEGVDLLLDAWREMTPSSGHELRLIGEGPLQDLVLERCAADPSVRYLGAAQLVPVEASFRGSAMVVFPRGPRTTGEYIASQALSFGRPLLVTELGGSLRTAGESVGWISAPTTLNLAEAMERALKSRSTLVELGQAARRAYLSEAAANPQPSLREVYDELTRVPRGTVIFLGPDGSGKSLLVDSLLERAEQQATPVQRAHFAPRLLRLRRHATKTSPVSEPHSAEPRSVAASVVKVVALWCDFQLGWWLRWKPAGRKGVVLLERPWHDQIVDPRRYRLDPRVLPLVRGLGLVMPKADRALVLHAEPTVIHSRKPELEVGEIARQQSEWINMAPLIARRTSYVETGSNSPSQSLLEVADAECGDAPTMSWGAPKGFPRRVDARITKGPVPGSRSTVYKASRPRARWSSSIGFALARVGFAPESQAPIDLAALETALGSKVDAAFAIRSSRQGRWILCLERAGRPWCAVKYGDSQDRGLRREAELLRAMATGPRRFKVPAVLHSAELGDHFILATEWTPSASKAYRPASLHEVALMSAELTSGELPTGAVVHGDLAPWNLIRGTAALVLIDWESAEFVCRPLWDLAHYVVQTAALVERSSPRSVVRLLTEERSPGHTHLDALKIPLERAPELLSNYLSEVEPSAKASVNRYRSRLLDFVR